MRLAGALVVMSLVAATPACTLVTIGLTASTISTHNEIADSHWNYTTPLVISAIIGLAADIGILLYMGDAWSKPMT